jgi:hypothetical protein
MACSLGEGSVKLHQGLKSNPVHMDREGVKRAAAALREWGGGYMLKACAK